MSNLIKSRRLFESGNKPLSSSVLPTVTNYNALPDPITVSGKYYWASLPVTHTTFFITFTDYENGLYYSNGTTWEHLDVPYQATQAEVDAGTDSDKYVTSLTLTNATVITNKELLANKQTDLTASAIKYPTVDAVNTGIATAIASIMSGASTFVFANVASDIGGVYLQIPALSNYTTASLATITTNISTTPTLMGVFATNLNFPNVTAIPTGIFTGHYETQKASGSNNYYTYFEIYKRNLAGTETLLATSDNSTQTAINTVVQQSTTALISTPIALLTTDRLVIKIYGVMLSASVNIGLLFDDTTNARLEIPFAPLSPVFGDAAYKNTGTTAGTVAAGDDARIGIFTLQSDGGASSPADSTTYYQGLNLVAATTTVGSFSFNIGFAFTIIGAIVSVGGNTITGTTEDSVLKIRNDTQATSSSIGNFKTNGSPTVAITTTFTGLNISVATGDFIAIQWDTPAYATNPTTARVSTNLICMKS